ncbi:MAG TPA: aminotransferase class V-fold PLP-dependent enzyme [Pirellulales bacterium]|jgi:cysteine desulfurase family protein|nr:aminotransferase class V-fold PLP-dependent enzyme [Pirellulales bacterium]
MPPRRLYFDNAATSWPKPESVYRAVDRFQREVGAAAGRGAYAASLEADRIVAAARRHMARLLGSESSRQIVFANSGTDSLNLALHGWLRPGDHVVTTAAEHNSVLRPLGELAVRRQIGVTRVACDSAGLVDPDDIRRALRPATRLVAIVHASNVTGAIQPAEEIGQVVRSHGAAFLIDAAQTIGHLPISVNSLNADFLAAPAHKGLLGPLGTGLLYIRAGRESELLSFRQGGTGTRSQDDRQPDSLPDKYEAGNLNMPGLAGLAAAVEFLEQEGVAAIAAREAALADRLQAGLQEIIGVTVYGPADSSRRVGVASINIRGYDPQEAATLLDCSFGIQVRGGLHCAPAMHERLGTLATGGTVRFSLGAFNSESDVDAAIAGVATLARNAID